MGIEVVICNDNVYNSSAYGLYKSLVPSNNLLRIRSQYKSDILNNIINRNITMFSKASSIYERIYNNRMIEGITDHPVTDLLPDRVELADKKYFSSYNPNVLFIRLRRADVSYDRDEEKKNPTVSFINADHEWVKYLSSIDDSEQKEQIRYKIKDLIRNLVNSISGEKQNEILNEISRIPQILQLIDYPIQVSLISV